MSADVSINQDPPKILFENNFFIAVDKPALWLAVRARHKSDSRPVLSDRLNQAIGGGPFLPCHRLDFEVCGIMLFAKTPAAHRDANIWFEAHKIKKTYEALTEGSAETAAQFTKGVTWTSHIVRGKKRSFEAPHGRLSITVAQFCGTHPSELLQFKLNPKTGRPHQLRFELSRHGFPIAGDKLYGAKLQYLGGDHGIALRATQLDFSNCSDYQKYQLPECITTQGLF